MELILAVALSGIVIWRLKKKSSTNMDPMKEKRFKFSRGFNSPMRSTHDRVEWQRRVYSTVAEEDTRD